MGVRFLVRFGMLILNPMISTVIKKQRSGPVLRAVLARGGDVWNVFEISINGMSTPVQDTENADFEITGLVAGSSCNIYLYAGGYAIVNPTNGCDITLDTNSDDGLDEPDVSYL